MAFTGQEKVLLEMRLKDYTEKCCVCTERLETESDEAFVLHIADTALIWTLLMRMATQFGGEEEIKASRESLDETIERFRPNPGEQQPNLQR